MSRITYRVLALVLLAGTAQAQPANVRVVNAAAPPGGDGRAWATAYNDLQIALDDAAGSSGAISEIWVAAGTYVPSRLTIPSDPRSATFQLASGLAIYGGFAGTEETAAQRDPVANVTSLSGVLDQTRSFHVVTATGVDRSAVLDGFTISGGSAFSSPGEPPMLRGGGVYADPGSPTMRRLILTGNFAANGGGAYLAGSPHLESCRIESNEVLMFGSAAGLWLSGAALLTDCLITGHTTTNQVIWAGGTPVLVGCTISFNDTDNGSALEGSGTFTDCVFSNNTGNPGGGAVYGSGTFTRCTFSSNTVVAGFGGAVFGRGSFDRCIFDSNVAAMEGGGAVYGTGSFVNCLFRANLASTGSAIDATSPASLVNCTFVDNSGSPAGGAVHGSNTLTNCILWGSGAARSYHVDGGTLSHCTVQHWDGGLPGPGNSGEDPRFVNAPGADFRLLPESACIDSGDNSAPPAGAFADLDRHARFFDAPNADTGQGTPPLVDRGCYEAGAPEFCYANIDNSVTPPLANVGDFVGFLNLYAAAHPLANCDASTAPPTLNVLDFVCFVNTFAGGCP